MMFFRRASAYPGFKNEVFTAIFLTISFLGGGVEIVYGIFFILFFMVIFSFESPSPHPYPSFTNPPHPPFSKGGIKGGLRPILTRFRSLMIVSIIFLFLSAVQLVPFIE